MYSIENTYFAYGSNMDLNRIQKRCPSARKISNGQLHGYELSFNMRGILHGTTGGGVANIIVKPNSIVHGVIYSMPTSELQYLNDLEVSANYQVVTEPIKTEAFETINATLYIGETTETGNWEPTDTYRNYIVNGIRNNNLPTSYLEFALQIMDER